MVMISKPFATVLVLALALGGAGARAQTASPQVFKPAHGISLDVGSKKVAGYYMQGTNTCDLTLMVADLPNADGQVSGSSTRMNVPVKAGSTQRIFTADGMALEVSCALSAKLMTLRPPELTALAVK